MNPQFQKRLDALNRQPPSGSNAESQPVYYMGYDSLSGLTIGKSPILGTIKGEKIGNVSVVVGDPMQLQLTEGLPRFVTPTIDREKPRSGVKKRSVVTPGDGFISEIFIQFVTDFSAFDPNTAGSFGQSPFVSGDGVVPLLQFVPAIYIDWRSNPPTYQDRFNNPISFGSQSDTISASGTLYGNSDNDFPFPVTIDINYTIEFFSVTDPQTQVLFNFQVDSYTIDYPDGIPSEIQLTNTEFIGFSFQNESEENSLNIETTIDINGSPNSALNSGSFTGYAPLNSYIIKIYLNT